MRRHVTLALATAVALAAASQAQQAQAAITLSITKVDSTLLDPALVTAGYSGYLITINASGKVDIGTTTSNLVDETISSVDFFHAPTGSASGGIFTTGNANIIEQASRGATGSFRTPSTLNSLENTWTTGQLNDSTFLTFGYWTNPVDPVTESTPTAGSPVVGGTTGVKYIQDQGIYGTPDPEPVTAQFGLDNSMTFSAGTTVLGQLTSTELALVIAPTNMGNVFLSGVVLDQRGASTGTFTFANVVVNAAVPEPASLGVLALGGLSLLAKRRKRA